jgi:hypothetical protein
MGVERKTALIAVAAIAASCVTISRAGCKEFAAAIDSSQKIMAVEYAVSVADNSAARETSRQLRVSNEIAAIMVNMKMMEAMKCPLPSTPIDTIGMVYLDQAIACHLATVRDGADSAKAKCKRSDWKPNAKIELAPQ